MQNRPLILVTNDDGITAPGINALIEVALSIGDVFIMAPSTPQSGMGHAITVNDTLYVEKHIVNSNAQNSYTCSGTPVDCVKIAIHEFMDRKPDLCISGINHGANSSINVIYSGTMSAAVEGGIEGIPSIGFSLLDFSWNADFSAAKYFAKQIIEKVLTQSLPKHSILNVNIPNLPLESIKGVKVGRQAKAQWVEKFDKRTSPHGKDYYWLTGEFVNEDLGQDTDEWALKNGYVSVVPIQFDLTAYHLLPQLNILNYETNAK